MADAQIAHLPEDRARAEALAAALRKRGLSVTLEDNQAAKAHVALWSQSALEDAAFIEAAGEARGRNALLSALIAAVPPEAVLQSPIFELSRWPEEEAEPQFERLVQAIAALRGRPVTAAMTRARFPRTVQVGLFAAGIAAFVVLAVIAATHIATPERSTARLASDAPAYDEAEMEGDATDVLGAADSYGLTPEELRGFAPADLIRLALERTSIEAIEAGATADDALGLTLLCLSRAYGEGLEQDGPAARRACEAASAKGDALATYMLSTFARTGAQGYGANVADEANADRLLERAAQANDPRAQTELARAFIQAEDGEEARRFARLAADQGYFPAQYLLGWMHEHGEGAPQDYPLAMQWYIRASEGGSRDALRAIGALYEQGLGVAQDYARARALYARASDMGDGEASQRLGAMAEQGLDGPADLVRARTFYQRALQQGYSAAQADIARVGPG
ncbi:MAG: tetratricopeptide repeat protein [Hyphomonadaceae bacterium]